MGPKAPLKPTPNFNVFWLISSCEPSFAFLLLKVSAQLRGFQLNTEKLCSRDGCPSIPLMKCRTNCRLLPSARVHPKDL
jgi:hypothetical protein